jgi:hypothetical protein
VRVNVLVIFVRLLPHVIILPEFPVQSDPRLLQSGRSRPTPSTLEISAVPQQQVGECCGHSKVSGKEIDDPCRRVEGEALLCEESRVDFEVVVEDEELVIHGPMVVKEDLRELRNNGKAGQNFILRDTRTKGKFCDFQMFLYQPATKTTLESREFEQQLHSTSDTTPRRQRR